MSILLPRYHEIKVNFKVGILLTQVIIKHLKISAFINLRFLNRDTLTCQNIRYLDKLAV